MRLEPFVRVDGTPFATSRDDVLRARGVPLRQGRNAVGLTELDYDDVVYRFQDSGRLEEVTSRAAVLVMGSVAVPFRSLEAFVRAQDPAVFERVGFVVSPKFGLAFVPSEPCWVTALARHCLPEWEAL
jgi:hypothetical protein